MVAVDGEAGNQFAPSGKYACERAPGAPRRQSWSGFWGCTHAPQKNCDDEVSRTERGRIEGSMDAPKIMPEFYSSWRISRGISCCGYSIGGV